MPHTKPGLALFLASSLAGAASAGDVEVTQKDKTFLPGEVTMKVGDTLLFHNDDEVIHNMFSRSEGFEFNLKLQKPGEDMRQSFQKPGTAVVRCAIHPKMKLVVKVED
jgi:plastocyanin